MRKAESAYQSIRAHLLAGDLAPSEKLTELAWVAELKTGRSAVREALGRLAGEGLVQRVRASYRVTAPTPKDIHEFRQLREIFEIGALRTCGTNGKIPAVRLKEIRAAANDFAQLSARGYLAGAREADLAFHRALVAAAGNHRLLHLYQAANLPLFQTTVGPAGRTLDDYRQTQAEHEAIVANLEDSRFTQAITALERHLRRGENSVLSK
jgi:DNA-binding GntR family transcriptional regulator